MIVFALQDASLWCTSFCSHNNDTEVNCKQRGGPSQGPSRSITVFIVLLLAVFVAARLIWLFLLGLVLVLASYADCTRMAIHKKMDPQENQVLKMILWIVASISQWI